MKAAEGCQSSWVTVTNCHRPVAAQLERMHNEMRLLSLEQRRNIQLLKLLYARSREAAYIKHPACVLRDDVKIRFRLMTKCSGKYLKSPLFRGSVLWDTIATDVQRSVTMNVFRKHADHLYHGYNDLKDKVIS